ncbi:lysine--tRNA ligase, partial [Streptomyces sp. NPDC048551]
MSATLEETRGTRNRFLNRVPDAFGAFFGSLGLLCALLSLSPTLRGLLRPVVDFLDDFVVPVSANLAYAVFLFLLAAALGMRKKIAWWIVVTYLALLVLVDVLIIADGDLWVGGTSMAIAVVTFAVLIAARREFYAASRPGAVWRAMLVLGLGLLAAVLLGWGLVALFPGTLPKGQWLDWAAKQVFGGLFSARQFDGRPPRPVYFVLGLLGALALLNAASTLFRSQRLTAALHGDEEPRIRALLRAYGRADSLGYFATRRDKAVVFAPNGKADTGDPVAPEPGVEYCPG